MDLAVGTYLLRTSDGYRVGHVDQPRCSLRIGHSVVGLIGDVASGRTGAVERDRSSDAALDKLREFGVIGDVEPLRDIHAELPEVVGIYPDLDADADFTAAARTVRGDTLSSPPAMFATWSAVQHVVRAGIPGAFAECGVWRGGSSMLMALAAGREAHSREFWLYDTYEWSWKPTRHDKDGLTLAPGASYRPAEVSDCFMRGAGVVDVRNKMLACGALEENLYTVQGFVEDELTSKSPHEIAVLRLDTDFYESTMAELTVLYPRLRPGGILIIDDYGKLSGPTAAVDEYFSGPTPRPFFSRISNQGRIGVKV
ncbi:TylF/MycF/NovP-related O-methyltransferase [Nocardioides zeae]|uniref:Macrocin O-methyltransferase n=1 Tax=Nocardioides zeae TaxID=1457234 RepID=A0A6P0HNB4_9ACTN|nr:TylF/MycF/NovP-related O-methyltransferase [Nocardioides zeae]NEN79780.1 hypothetical protein [Nocardioides zeae]